VISSGISGLLAFSYLLWGKTAYHFRWHHVLPKFGIIKDIYRVGGPSILMEALEAVVFSLFNHVAASFGSVVLAAIGIAGRISDMAFMPVIGTAHGLLPIIGFSLGAKLWKRLWKAVKLASLGIAGFLFVATIFMEIFTPQIIRVFNSDPVLLAIAVPGMRIFCTSFVVVGPTVLFITTFQGLSKGKEALILNVCRQFAFFVPLLFLLSNLWGLTGVWIAMPISDFFGFLVAGAWIYREYRKQKNSSTWDQTQVAQSPQSQPEPESISDPK
jgi:Na+-driven multidrug efflux pump